MSQPKANVPVLIVDDDPGVRLLSHRTLRRQGIESITLASGEELVQWLTHSRCDLLLLDLKLADTRAEDLLTRLLDRHLMVPFIIITGQGDERVAVEMMKRGALDYIVKDTEFHDLLPAVVLHALNQIARDKRLEAAEAELKISEEHYRMLFQNNPLPTWVYDIRTMQFLAVNRAAIDHYGFSEQEFLAMNIREIRPADEVVSITRELESRSGSGPSLGQRKHKRKDGTVIEVETVSHPLTFRGQEARLVVANDITERRRLEREIIEISSREQQRIGQDLHDGLGQQLAGIELLCQVLLSKISVRSRGNYQLTESIGDHVRQAIVQSRMLARGLSPVVLDSGGFVAALKDMATNVSSLFQIECMVNYASPMVVQNHSAATHLYRIAQEAINNAVKHGKAQRVMIHLERLDDGNKMAIESDGRPFQNSSPSGLGMGLRVMEYRARQIDAALSIEPRSGGGCVVTCIFRRDL